MQIVRTILWLLIVVALLLFSWANWEPGVTVRIWEGIVVDTRLPAVVLLSFLAGLVPMWLYYRSMKWRMNRRMKAMQDVSRISAMAPVSAPSYEGETARRADTGTHDKSDDGARDEPLTASSTPDSPLR